MNKASTAETAAAPAADAATNWPVIKDAETVARIEEYGRLARAKSDAEKRMKTLKPVIEAAIGDAPGAYAGRCVVTLQRVAEIPATPNQVITKAHLGQVIEGKPGRAAYTQLTVR